MHHGMPPRPSTVHMICRIGYTRWHSHSFVSDGFIPLVATTSKGPLQTNIGLFKTNLFPMNCCPTPFYDPTQPWMPTHTPERTCLSPCTPAPEQPIVHTSVHKSEGGMTRLETLIELKFLNSRCFELVLLLKLNKQFPVEQVEATVSQSTLPSPPS